MLAGALALMVIAGMAALVASGTLALTSAGPGVALLVVGLVLHYEGVRQRQRPDSRQPRRAER